MVRRPGQLRRAGGHGGLRDDRASSAAKGVKELDPGKAAGSGRCYGIPLQWSGSLARTWADCPAATTSIHGVPASSGGAIASSSVASPLSPTGLGGVVTRGVPAAGAVADPQGGQGPDCSVVLPVVFHRDTACVQVQDGAVLAVVQAEDGDPGAGQRGQFDRCGGPAAGRGCRQRHPVMVAGQHAQPPLGQVGGGRCGDAVVGDTQAGAKPGELARGRAGRGQRAGRLQCGDDVTEPAGGMRQ